MISSVGGRRRQTGEWSPAAIVMKIEGVVKGARQVVKRHKLSNRL